MKIVYKIVSYIKIKYLKYEMNNIFLNIHYKESGILFFHSIQTHH